MFTNKRGNFQHRVRKVRIVARIVTRLAVAIRAVNVLTTFRPNETRKSEREKEIPSIRRATYFFSRNICEWKSKLPVNNKGCIRAAETLTANSTVCPKQSRKGDREKSSRGSYRENYILPF